MARKRTSGKQSRLAATGDYAPSLRYPWRAALDLNDGDITGGEADHVTLGLNWYVNPHLRFMANYVFVDNDDAADDAGDVVGDDDPGIFQLRAQLDF